MATTPVYEKNFTNSLCYIDTIQLNEYDNSINNTGYTYSGITLILDYTGFTSHFNTTGHTYSNVILNNDVYTYTGITGETHYFTISDFYSGSTSTIDPLLTGFSESEIVSGFTTSIIHCADILDGLTGTCCPTQAVLSNLPWVAITNEGGGTDNCSDYIARRNEKGWTLDYVFNKNGLTGWTDSVFFFTGVRDEYDPINYADNNLSFKFTEDGRIKWSVYRYSGYCDTVSGYTPVYYISTGQTIPLCTGGTSDDFNITIVFERYYYYVDCEIPNEGGWNDLINTGYTSTTSSTIVTGTTTEELNHKWLDERSKRLGKLKIFHNGRPVEIDDVHSSIANFRNVPVYVFKDWEEVVLSDRGFQPFVHAVGGGVTGSGDLHNSVCCYTIKYAAYFEDIMNFPYVFDRYSTLIKPSYTIVECGESCTDEVVMSTPSQTPTLTPTTSKTPSITPSITTSISVSPTITSTVTLSRTITPSRTPSRTPSISITPTITSSPTMSKTPSVTPSVTPSISISPTIALSPSVTKTPSITPSITPSKTITPSISKTPSRTPNISKTPSRTPSRTITPSITPSISKTPSRTPSKTPSKTPAITLSITPSITPTPSTSCARPLGLTEYKFLSLYDGPPITEFISSLNMACNALLLVGSIPFYGQTGYTSSLSIDEPVYYPDGTSCSLMGTGYYIIYTGGTPFIVYINDGYIGIHSICPSITPSITPSKTPTPTLTPSKTPTPTLTPSETPTPTLTPSETPTPTLTPSETPSITPSETPTPTPSG